MDIVVLCGGLSAERDVSIASGTKVAGALRRRGHRAVLIDLFFGYPKNYEVPSDIFEKVQSDNVAAIGESAPDLKLLTQDRSDSRSRIGENVTELCLAADIVFLALHGTDGEDGKVQAAFDLAGIRYTGTGSLGSSLAMNKDISKKLFSQSGIPTPESKTVYKRDIKYENVGFPCVVKPTSGGSSIGTSIVTAAEQYPAALELAFRYDDSAIVERYVEGRECSVGVIAGRTLPPIEICPKTGFYDYKNKYSGLTEEICPANLPDEIAAKIKAAAASVFQTLCLEVYGRIDFIVDEDGAIWCLEGNTLPGLTEASLLPQEAAAAGIPYEDLCELIIHESLKKYTD